MNYSCIFFNVDLFEFYCILGLSTKVILHYLDTNFGSISEVQSYLIVRQRLTKLLYY